VSAANDGSNDERRESFGGDRAGAFENNVTSKSQTTLL
jgi:hypothetical protein